MNWVYFLKVSFIFSALYLLFIIFLQGNTFHKTNRAFLLLVIPIALLLPLIKYLNYTTSNSLKTAINFQFGEFDGVLSHTQSFESQGVGISFTSILLYIYLTGVIIFAIRFLVSLLNLVLNRYFSDNKKKGRFTYIFPKNETKPHSFFYWIFVPKNLTEQYASSTIIDHEKTHAKQFHSVDNIIAEVFTIAFWFLPFAHLYKQSLKNIHEFLADKTFTSNIESRITYLKLLSSETENLVFSGISSTFYSKSLKKRISMISKPKSKNIKALRYTLFIPVIAFFTMAFSQHQIQTNSNEYKATIEATKESSFKLSYPIEQGNYKISSPFGERFHPIKKKLMMHNGIDFSAKSGTPVYASASGKIIKKEFKENSYGNVIVIEHENGYVTLYAQLSEFKTELNQNIKQGELIGLVGSSGMSTGPHLHFELRKNNGYLNPTDYLK